MPADPRIVAMRNQRVEWMKESKAKFKSELRILGFCTLLSTHLTAMVCVLLWRHLMGVWPWVLMIINWTLYLGLVLIVVDDLRFHWKVRRVHSLDVEHLTRYMCVQNRLQQESTLEQYDAVVQEYQKLVNLNERRWLTRFRRKVQNNPFKEESCS